MAGCSSVNRTPSQPHSHRQATWSSPTYSLRYSEQISRDQDESGTDQDQEEKKKNSTEDEKKIVKKAKQGKDAIEIAREYERETKIKVDRTTIGRLIHDHKLKWLIRQQVQELTAANKAKRLAYARAMSKYNWKRVLFSDEKTFYLGAMKTHAYQEPGKRKTFPVQLILLKLACGLVPDPT